VIADCDTGFRASPTWKRTIRATSVQRRECTSNQVFPSAAGTSSKSVVSTKEMMYRLQAALDAHAPPRLPHHRAPTRANREWMPRSKRGTVVSRLGVDAYSSNNRSVEGCPGRRNVPWHAACQWSSAARPAPPETAPGDGLRIILFANAALYLGSFAIREGLAVLPSTARRKACSMHADVQERQALIGLDKADLRTRSCRARRASIK
jgi:hypothetical protein